MSGVPFSEGSERDVEPGRKHPPDPTLAFSGLPET